MAIPITVPRLGWNMEEGKFGGWLKRDGEAVRPGDRLFALESEKATEEVECLDTGTLRIPADGPKAGDVLAVGTVIGYLDEPGEPDTGRLESSAGEPGRVSAGSACGPSDVAEGTSTPGADATGLAGGGLRRPGVSEPTRQFATPERLRITPRARRAAEQMGIDPTSLNGTGRDGRIRERDIKPKAFGRSEGSFVPLTPIRRTIAARMVECQRTTAPVTLTTTADATNLVSLRDQYRSATDAGPVPSYTDLIIKLAAGALRAHPILTGRWTDDGIRLAETIHIGIAVDTDAGLLVPVVRDVLSLGVRDLAAATRSLIDRARIGRLSAADMQGGCFTVTNLGAFGIDAFTPIINHPECAVLGVGRIARRPAVVGDAIVPRDQVTLSLTFDHRIVDGAPAARFFQTLTQAIENPAPRLMS